jgi:hypothetical protein
MRIFKGLEMGTTFAEPHIAPSLQNILGKYIHKQILHC